MKKILFVHPDLRGGGAEKVLVNMLNSLDKSKYEITLITIFEEGINKKLLLNHITHTYLLKKVFSGWSILQKIFSPEFLFKHLVKNDNDYDLIVAYLEGVPTRVVGGCKNNKTKLISWVHVDLDGFKIEKVFKSKKEMKNIYLKYDAIVGVSKIALNSLRKKVPEIPSNKLHVIHNILDISLILSMGNEDIKDICFLKDTVNLCTVGRLANQKGYIRLLYAISKLANDNINFHLYIIGQGEQEHTLAKIIIDEKLEKHVTLLGFRDNPHKYVKNCDLFVCSSYQEGFSTAVTEAVLLGTPILTTNCAGMDEILDNGEYGKIVENSDEALYIGLKELLTNRESIKKYKILTQKRSEMLQKKNNIYEIEKLFDNILN